MFVPAVWSTMCHTSHSIPSDAGNAKSAQAEFGSVDQRPRSFLVESPGHQYNAEPESGTQLVQTTTSSTTVAWKFSGRGTMTTTPPVAVAVSSTTYGDECELPLTMTLQCSVPG